MRPRPPRRASSPRSQRTLPSPRSPRTAIAHEPDSGRRQRRPPRGDLHADHHCASPLRVAGAKTPGAGFINRHRHSATRDTPEGPQDHVPQDLSSQARPRQGVHPTGRLARNALIAPARTATTTAAMPPATPSGASAPPFTRRLPHSRPQRIRAAADPGYPELPIGALVTDYEVVCHCSKSVRLTKMLVRDVRAHRDLRGRVPLLAQSRTWKLL